jgi:glycosyltransferase involved in cell wall biosynthesis
VVKILLCSHRFSPDIGGIETSSAALATEFAHLGHQIRLLTGTTRDDGLAWPFTVVRQPAPAALFRHARWCDIFFQNNVSVQTLWAALLARRPWVVAHQTWLAQTGEEPGWRARVKRYLFRLGKNVAISRSVAEHIGLPCKIIGNPYRNDLFREWPDVQRDKDLVYVGRLVSDKGLDSLLLALKELQKDALTPRLTIVGSGPEEGTLRALASELGVAAQVTFVGALIDVPLARLLNAHRVLVVPSKWAEPFGIVALEGIACGCVVVGSSGGGLPDAIGPCGLTFPNRDSTALASALQRLLTDDALVAKLRAEAPGHLARHTARAVAERYIEVFESCLL